MKYELQKVFSDRYMLLLLVVSVLSNGILFYQYCKDDSKGYTLAQVAQKYDMAEKLENELSLLEQQIWAIGADVEDKALLTDNIYQEFNLDAEVLDRISATANYQKFLQDTCKEASLKLHSGLFGPERSFSVRSLEQTIETYQSLYTVEVESSFSGGAEVLFQIPFTDMFLAMFGCAAGLLLITAERDSCYLALFCPMKKGRGSLYWQKFGAMTIIILSGAVFLYGTDVLIAQSLFGLGDLSRSVQSVHGFQGCPYALSVGGALAMFGGIKILWLLSVSSLFFSLCCLLNKAVTILSVSSLLLGTSILMQRSSNILLRSINLLSGAYTDRVLANCLYVNILEMPVGELSVMSFFYTLLLIVGSLVGLTSFCTRPVVLTQRQKVVRKVFQTGQHANLFAHECYKEFIMGGGLVILFGFAMVQFLSYRDFYIQQDTQEYYYQIYSEALSGKPSEEKDAYLISESNRFEELWEEYNWYVEHIASSDPDFELLTRNLTDELRAQVGFHLATAQYEKLQPGQSYIYATGWERLYGDEGISNDLINCAKLLFALSIVLSGIFSVEYETGVIAIQVTSGQTQVVSRAKWVGAICLLLIALAIAFLPQYWAVASKYYLNQLSAQANSLAIFSELPSFITLWEVLIVTNILRLFLGILAVWLIFMFSQRMKNTLITMLFSLSALLLPILVSVIL